MKPRPGSRLQHSATGRLASRAFAGGRGRSSPPRGRGCSSWARRRCCPGAELLRGPDPASPALPLPGPHPAAPLQTEAAGAGLASVLEESDPARRGRRELEGRCCGSSSSPAGLAGPALLSGRSGLLLPETAHGCTGVKSCSSMLRLAAARVNTGERAAVARRVPGSALAPLLGQLGAEG